MDNGVRNIFDVGARLRGLRHRRRQRQTGHGQHLAHVGMHRVERSHVEQAAPYFKGETNSPAPPDVKEFVTHVSRLPDVFRANVYGFDGTILWSSDPQMMGKKFDDNAALEQAMDGVLEPELSVVSGPVRRRSSRPTPRWSAGRSPAAR